MVGPAPSTPAGDPDADLGDSDGNVPLSALEDHLWLYESDYYQSLIEKANLTNPTELTSSGESIKIQHACINRALLPCKIIEQYWAPNLEERTNGQLILEVSSFPELGLAGPDTLQLVSEGTLSMANIYTGYVAGELPAIEVQSLWGIYPDWETMYYSLTDMHAQLEEMVARETGGGIVVNHNWYSGNDQFFFSKKPLRSLEDFDGLKTRSHAAALSDWINGMGADAQFIAFSEVYTALERGIIDAGVTGSTPGYGQRWYEVAGYLNGPLKSLLSTNNIVNAEVWGQHTPGLATDFHRGRHQVRAGAVAAHFHPERHRRAEEHRRRHGTGGVHARTGRLQPERRRNGTRRPRLGCGGWATRAGTMTPWRCSMNTSAPTSA